MTARLRLTVVTVFPDLLGTYGDRGNGMVLARRAAWRGIDVSLVEAVSTDRLPAADIYCIGGGEDGPQVRAAELLGGDDTFAGAVRQGAAVLGVCAGYQLLGRSFPDAGGAPIRGLGLLDVETVKGAGSRAVGELLAEASPTAPMLPGGVRLPPLTGFENHAGTTMLGRGAAPLARVVRGRGNGGAGRSEGAWSGRVVGTYLHGPVLARNPHLADLLLGWALGSEEPLATVDDVEVEAWRAERLAASASRRPAWSSLVR
ncbi:MAG: glutamine amidotransferase [Actinomycetota bacterium]|nr:glutamine amidotransferase [Actinomycetota bacterium]